MLPSDIDLSPLLPQSYTMRNGKTIHYFADNSVGIMKIDFIFEAGSALQTKPLQAAAATSLLLAGTKNHSAHQVAEFLDFRGIIAETSNNEVSSTLTLYTMPKYLPQLLPLLHQLLEEPLYPDNEFAVYVQKQRTKLMANLQHTPYVARRHWYQSLYGPNHPLGRYPNPTDYDHLSVSDLHSYHHRCLTPSRMQIILSGDVTPTTLKAFDSQFGSHTVQPIEPTTLPTAPTAPTAHLQVEVANAVQTTLRIGRLLPLQWTDRHYPELMLLTTALGGYFGSRLMANLREDKGYTYGISAQTQIRRGSLLFHIETDVASHNAEPALRQIENELARLCSQPLSESELQLVQNSMLGDFMRSIDGVFERGERYCQMLTSRVDERFTTNYISILQPRAVSPDHLLRLSQTYLTPQQMTIVKAGKSNA